MKSFFVISLIVVCVITIIVLLVLLVNKNKHSTCINPIHSADCPNITSVVPSIYTKYLNKDSPQGDIGRLNKYDNNIIQLKNSCDALHECKGFNKKGWLKYKVQEPAKMTKRPGIDMYVK